MTNGEEFNAGYETATTHLAEHNWQKQEYVASETIFKGRSPSFHKGYHARAREMFELDRIEREGPRKITPDLVRTWCVTMTAPRRGRPPNPDCKKCHGIGLVSSDPVPLWPSMLCSVPPGWAPHKAKCLPCPECFPEEARKLFERHRYD